MSKVNWELLLVILVLLVVVVSCNIGLANDEKQRPYVPPWEDPEMGKPPYFEPYDGR